MSRSNPARNRSREGVYPLTQGVAPANWYPGCAKSTLLQSIWHEAIPLARLYDVTREAKHKGRLIGAALMIHAHEAFFGYVDRGVGDIVKALVRDSRNAPEGAGQKRI